MSFGKFSVRQIIQNAACGMFCFEILNKEDYERIRREAVKVNPELVGQWDKVMLHKPKFPTYLTKRGTSITILYALQYNYYIISIDDIEFNLPTDLNIYICDELNKMDDHRKEQVLELVKKLAEEEKADQYWYLDSEGRISTCKASQNVTDTKDRILIGNYFNSLEDAEYEYHRRIMVKKWELIHEKLEKGSRTNIRYYFPCYDNLEEKVVVNCSESMHFGGLIFSTSENCQKAIDLIGKQNVKEYILGIRSGDDK